MVNRLICFGIISLFLMMNAPMSHATPSTTYWTPCTGDIQKFGVVHITYDTYTKGSADFPTDYGLTVGVLPFEKFQMEFGVDVLAPQTAAFLDNAVYLNAKVGTPEGLLFDGSPAWNFGVFNIGFNEDVNDYDVGHALLSKTIGKLGRVHVGGYYGFTDTLEITASNADGDRGGVMVAYDKFIYKDKIMLAADYMSGKNALGGGGAGLYYFFTPDISLLTGPVWFVDDELNGDWKWTLQLDINMDVFSNLFKKNK